MDLLRQVGDQILKDIGIASAGHRLRIRNAHSQGRPAPPADANDNASRASKHVPAAAGATPDVNDARRQLVELR
jgi:hypothetical protein